jgi:hypothetical protein
LEGLIQTIKRGFKTDNSKDVWGLNTDNSIDIRGLNTDNSIELRGLIQTIASI